MTDGVVKIRNAKYKRILAHSILSVIATPVAIIHALLASSRPLQRNIRRATQHYSNLRYYQRLMAGLRKAIEEGN